MDNYKIKVKDEAESKEAQELFEQLGYGKGSVAKTYPSWISNFEYSANKEDKYTSEPSECWAAKCKEITLPQLRDLVVLKRNDVKDATNQDKYDASLKYVYLNGEWYEWINGWMAGCINPSKLIPIAKPQDPALISGAEAHQALLAGENVQYSGYGEQYWDTALNCNIGVFLNHEKFPDFKFRIAPRTIKVELELPKPFEPQVGEWYFFVSTENDCGYSTNKFEGLDRDVIQTQFGAYRTANEVEQVVEQLRKIRGTNS